MLLGASGLPLLDLVLSMDYALLRLWYFYSLEQLEI